MFMSDVSIIVRKMRTFAERNQTSLGIGFPEQLVLMCLMAHGSSNQDAIASYLDIDKGAVAKTVAKLEEKGLVTREVNPDNRREKLVTPLPAASGTLESMKDDYQALDALMFNGLSQEEKAVTLKCIATIAQNMSTI